MLAFPFEEGGPLAVDEVFQDKATLIKNTSSVVAKRCADTFPKGEGYFCCVRAVCFVRQIPFAVTV